ncbi:unnamed protein product [marine sediment metagenome]|uniref:Uncharacterized protein n=1 Tax=marine sediment metagenome TaxID=412755 RepID=X0SI45_9ZZZZ
MSKKEYRVDLYKLLKAFLDFYQDNDMSPTQGMIYVALANKCNKLKWPLWMNFDYEDICEILHIRPNTFYNNLQKLVDFGLIKWKKGVRGHSLGKLMIIDVQKIRKKVVLTPNDNTSDNTGDNTSDNSLVTGKEVTNKEDTPLFEKSPVKEETEFKKLWGQAKKVYAPHEVRKVNGKFVHPDTGKRMVQAEIKIFLKVWNEKLKPLNKALRKINKESYESI